MKKINRLRKNHDFQRVINSKNSLVSKHLVIYFIKNKTNETRIGISISKKFMNAVGRNKIRRQVRSILDDPENKDIWNKSYDVVLIIRKPFISANYSEKLLVINKLMKRI